jgi:hypothetical protein
MLPLASLAKSREKRMAKHQRRGVSAATYRGRKMSAGGEERA